MQNGEKYDILDIMTKANKSDIKIAETKKDDRGRPSKYNEKLHCQIARLGVMAGLTEKEISAEIGVSESTLNLWKKEHPSFSEALKDSRIGNLQELEKSVFRRAMGFHYRAQKPMTVGVGVGFSEIQIAEYKEYCPPNVTAAIFYLKRNWPEKYGDKLGEEGEALIKKLDSVLEGVKGELQR